MTLMKTLDEQDHYEVLEVGRNASPEEIERAFRIAHTAYASDALAHYSIFECADAEQIRSRIELAYEVLSNEDRRRSYNQSNPEREGAAPPVSQHTPLAVEIYEAPSSGAPEIPPAVDAFAEMDVEVEEESQDFDGAHLRRARMRRGIELDQIARVTKVSPAYLRFLEEENFSDLPAAVYVRGFVNAYARAIGLDAEHVAASYMTTYDEAQGTAPRGRLLGRR